MSITIDPKYERYLEAAESLWLTTVRADGMPQPTPVWFIRDSKGDFLVYSMPDAQKVKNIRQNPHVALALNIDVEMEYYIVVMGEAVIDESLPSSLELPAYQAKYRDAIPAINFTPQSLAASFSLPIRIRPTFVRGSLESDESK